MTADRHTCTHPRGADGRCPDCGAENLLVTMAEESPLWPPPGDVLCPKCDALLMCLGDTPHDCVLHRFVTYEVRCKCWPLPFTVRFRGGTTYRVCCPKCGSNRVQSRLQAERGGGG